MWKVDKEGNLENTHQSLMHCPRCDIFQTIVITYLTKRVESWGVRSSRVRSSRVRSLSIWSRQWQIFSDTNIFSDIRSYQFWIILVCTADIYLKIRFHLVRWFEMDQDYVERSKLLEKDMLVNLSQFKYTLCIVFLWPNPLQLDAFWQSGIDGVACEALRARGWWWWEGGGIFYR